MKRFLLFAALLSSSASAATISSAACPGTGCSVSFVADTPALAVQVTGTWSGTVVIEVSNDAVTFFPTRAYPVNGAAYSSGFSGNGAWTALTGGLAYIRFRATAWTSGTATITTRPAGAVIPADLVRAVGSTFGAVDVIAPDGGLPVSVADPVRVVGPTFGEVEVSGVVDLSSATLASMGNYLCTTAESHRLSLTTTPVAVPASGVLPNRTSWTLINQDAIKRVTCRVDPGDGGVPDCATPGFGITVQPGGGTLTFPVRDTDTVRCVACTNGATVEHTEEACVAP